MLIDHFSGVLAESLSRSKQRWISEGIFQRYWTKPVKKKGEKIPFEPPGNPGKDTMTKLGACTISVEPHVFEATMYAVKDPASRAPPAQPVAQAMYRPIIQYGPPNTAGSQPLPVPQRQYQHVSPATQASPRPVEANQAMNGRTPPTSNSYATPMKTENSHGIQPPSQTPPTPLPPPTNLSIPGTPAAAPPPVAKSPDPVIQMLATRAATDQDLKALMRIVAAGNATHDQLKRFQAHIDELTAILKSRAAATGPTPLPAVHPHSLPPQHLSLSNAPKYLVPPQPQALRSKGPPAPPKADIAGIVFEFTSGSGDRFSFPSYSILEFNPATNEVIASFLLIRKGSAANATLYDPALDYYQPITIRIGAQQPRILESLNKVVKPGEEVRRYMDEVMDGMTRAEYVLLAMRLPKNPDAKATEDDGLTIRAEKVDNEVLWTKTPEVAVKMKAVKPLPGEEEQFRAFVASVS